MRIKVQVRAVCGCIGAEINIHRELEQDTSGGETEHQGLLDLISAAKRVEFGPASDQNDHNPAGQDHQTVVGRAPRDPISRPKSIQSPNLEQRETYALVSDRASRFDNRNDLRSQAQASQCESASFSGVP